MSVQEWTQESQVHSQKNYLSVKFSWPIERYARLKVVSSSETQNDSSWEHYSSAAGELYLSILFSNRVIINQGNAILENHDLALCGNYMEGVANGDSLLCISKIDCTQRQFRVKFNSNLSQSGIETCNDSCNELAQYFPIRQFSSTNPSHSQNKAGDVLEMTVQDVSKLLLNPDDLSLPIAYKKSPLPDDKLEEIVWLCLSDPNFPAFVLQVSNVLKSLANIG